MDIEEIEAWYDEQKEKLTEEYMLKLAKSKNPEKLKKNYLRSMHRLRAKYEKLSSSRINKDLKWHFLKYRLLVLWHRITLPLQELKEKHLKNRK